MPLKSSAVTTLVTRQDRGFVYRTKLAESMSIPILQALAKSVQLVVCEKGCPVVLEGEVGDHMYILVSGCCVVEKADRMLSPSCALVH
jgi:CRP-like cAMP-binding protein